MGDLDIRRNLATHTSLAVAVACAACTTGIELFKVDLQNRRVGRILSIKSEVVCHFIDSRLTRFRTWCDEMTSESRSRSMGSLEHCHCASDSDACHAEVLVLRRSLTRKCAGEPASVLASVEACGNRSSKANHEGRVARACVRRQAAACSISSSRKTRAHLVGVVGLKKQ